MDVVERVSRARLILDGGRIVADGRLDDLKARAGDGTLEALFRLTAGDVGAERATHVMRALGSRPASERGAGLPPSPLPPRRARRVTALPRTRFGVDAVGFRTLYGAFRLLS
jgi:hypothetical protein